jgi:ketosteroid isomerase-like protein
MTQSLAKPIADYVDASNAFDTAAMLAIFKDDAVVNDTQREFWGKEAIKTWIDKELVSARVKMTVVKFVERYGDVILIAKIGREPDSGSVPNPLVLTFYFNVRDGKISQLIILQNK